MHFYQIQIVKSQKKSKIPLIREKKPVLAVLKLLSIIIITLIKNFIKQFCVDKRKLDLLKVEFLNYLI